MPTDINAVLFFVGGIVGTVILGVITNLATDPIKAIIGKTSQRGRELVKSRDQGARTMARCMSQDIQLLVIRQASLILRIVNTAAMSIMCFITATFFWIAVSPTLPESKGILTVDEILVAAVVGFFFFTGLIAMLFAQSLLAFNTTSLNHLVDIVQGDLPEEEQREESPGEVEDGESPSTGSLS